jgi:hypothetical protein
MLSGRGLALPLLVAVVRSMVASATLDLSPIPEPSCTVS